MKNRIGSIIASIFLLLVVGALVYMFYVQTLRIRDLRNKVEILEINIETMEGEKTQMEGSLDAMETVLEEKNEEIDKLNDKIDTMDDNAGDIDAIREILEDNFKNNDYYEEREVPDNSQVEVISFIDMTSDELIIYESFKDGYNDEMLTAVEPFTIMKLYLYSGFMKDYETEYELYVDYVEGGMNWTKEEHLNFPEEDMREDYGIFETAYDMKVEAQGKYAVITWKSDYDNEEAFSYSFSLKKNDDGIWKVNFLPMQ
jgi:hypothetical protein